MWMMVGMERRRQKPEAFSRELGEDRAAATNRLAGRALEENFCTIGLLFFGPY